MVRAGTLGLSLIAGLFLMQGCAETPVSALEEFDEPDSPIMLAGSEKKLDHLTTCAPTAANFPNPLGSTNRTSRSRWATSGPSKARRTGSPSRRS